MQDRQVTRTLIQALRLCTGRMTHRVSRGTALTFHDQGTRRGEGSASRPGRSLAPGKTRYPFYRRLSVLQARSGQVREISPTPGFDPRTVQPVASRHTGRATRLTWPSGARIIFFKIWRKAIVLCYWVFRGVAQTSSYPTTRTSTWTYPSNCKFNL